MNDSADPLTGHTVWVLDVIPPSREERAWVAFMAAAIACSNWDTSSCVTVADMALAEWRKRYGSKP